MKTGELTGHVNQFPCIVPAVPDFVSYPSNKQFFVEAAEKLRRDIVYKNTYIKDGNFVGSVWYFSGREWVNL